MSAAVLLAPLTHLDCRSRDRKFEFGFSYITFMEIDFEIISLVILWLYDVLIPCICMFLYGNDIFFISKKTAGLEHH